MEIKIVDTEKAIASSRQYGVTPLAGGDKMPGTQDSFITPQNARGANMKRTLDHESPMNILENNDEKHLEGAHNLEGHSLYGGSSN